MAEAQLFMFIAALWTLVVTILWLVIGWRAMKAHERLAESHDEIRHAVRAFVKGKINQSGNN